MRQDIVDVLKTSHMDLVRALIGLPPYAVHRWHSAYLKIVAGLAFRYMVYHGNMLLLCMCGTYCHYIISVNMAYINVCYSMRTTRKSFVSSFFFPFFIYKNGL